MKQERFDFLSDELEQTSVEDTEELNEWKRKKREAKARFTAMQNLPYEVKVRRAEQRVYEFLSEMNKRGCNAHVSVGGLDSITLLLFIRKLGIDVPAISVSSVEDKSIQSVHKMLGLERVTPYRTKVEILNEVGFPVISKKIAGIHLEKRPHRFDRLREQNPAEWEFWMYRCCTDKETGEKFGWGRVLDWIGVEWEDYPAVQLSLFDK